LKKPPFFLGWWIFWYWMEVDFDQV